MPHNPTPPPGQIVRRDASAAGSLAAITRWGYDGAELPVGGRTTLVFESDSGPSPQDLSVAGVRPAETVAVPIAVPPTRSASVDNSVIVYVLSRVPL